MFDFSSLSCSLALCVFRVVFARGFGSLGLVSRAACSRGQKVLEKQLRFFLAGFLFSIPSATHPHPCPIRIRDVSVILSVLSVPYPSTRQAAACAGFTMSAFMELNWYGYKEPPKDPRPVR